MMCFSAWVLIFICSYGIISNEVGLIIWICISVLSLIGFTLYAMENGDF